MESQTNVPAIQVALKTVDVPQTQVSGSSADTPVAMQHQVPMYQEAQMRPYAPQLRRIMKEKGRRSQLVPDRMVHEAERSQDEDEANEAKTDAKNGLKDNCVIMRNTVSEENLNLKFEARDKERTEKAVQDARNRLDKNPLAENDDKRTEVVN